jgi:hypothetical protein
MIATPATRLTPRSPAGITICQATSDAGLAAAVQHHAYQMPHPPAPHDIARLARLTLRGGLVAIAVDESSGTVTGTGLIDINLVFLEAAPEGEQIYRRTGFTDATTKI